jgi:uncharacterized protein YbjT (DUF2867 family)
MLGISHPKLKEVLHPDFADCSALADALSSQNAAVFCLGAYTGAVSDAELRKITVDYTIEFARALHAANAAAAFSFLSGSGADPTGRSRLAFARYKGEAESALLAAGFSRVYIFRPAYIYPVEPRASRVNDRKMRDDAAQPWLGCHGFPGPRLRARPFCARQHPPWRGRQIVGPDHLVGEQHAERGIDCTQQTVTEIRLLAWTPPARSR